jgi:hypothetical protein
LGIVTLVWAVLGDADVCVWTGTDAVVFMGGTVFGGAVTTAGAGLALASARRLRAPWAILLTVPMLVIGGLLLASPLSLGASIADQMVLCP